MSRKAGEPNLQFTTAYHVAYDEDMTMSAYCQEDASNSKKCEHLLAGFRTCIAPSVNASIKALGEVVMLRNIEPCRFFGCEILDVLRSGLRSLTYASWVALMKKRNKTR